MPDKPQFTLGKDERISSFHLENKLFRGGGGRSMTAFPLRMVYLIDDCEKAGEPRAKMLVSVPKRLFKHAVDRNRVKRQVREAYRLNKQIVIEPMERHEGKTAAVAFLWLDDKHHSSAHIHRKVKNLLTRLAEKL